MEKISIDIDISTPVLENKLLQQKKEKYIIDHKLYSGYGPVSMKIASGHVKLKVGFDSTSFLDLYAQVWTKTHGGEKQRQYWCIALDFKRMFECVTVYTQIRKRNQNEISIL